MNVFKRLAGDTLIYGLGTIVPKILNFSILTSYYTRIFEPGDYGIIQELYSYVLFIMVFLTFGLETGYFRFATKEKIKGSVYSNASIFIITLTSIFVVFSFVANGFLAARLGYSESNQFLLIMTGIISIDAVSALPFARLRLYNKAFKFSILKLISVVLNVILVTTFFSVIVPNKFLPDKIIQLFGRANIGFILYANLLASFTIYILLLPEVKRIRFNLFSIKQTKELIIYSFPIFITGFAGMVNETLDKILMKPILSEYDLGVYSANYKIAILLSLFIQMYRYAFEPIVFKLFGDKNDKKMYARTMQLFVAVGLLIMIGINYYIDFIKILIDHKYHNALHIVPIVLWAYLFYGIFFNLSIWYKLTNRTWYGAYITFIGAGITIFFNIWLVPRYGYVFAAWGHFYAMLVMAIISCFIGRKYYKVNYNYLRIFEYLGIYIVLYILNKICYVHQYWYHFIQLIVIFTFVVYLLKREQLFNQIIYYVKNKSSK